MMRKEASIKKPLPGTVLGAKMRAECNKLTDAQREKLGEEFMKLYYGGLPTPATTHRR